MQFLDTGIGKVERLVGEEFQKALGSNVWDCPGCKRKMKRLNSHNGRRDEFYCDGCKLSIPLFNLKVGPVDSNWPPRNLEPEPIEE